MVSASSRDALAAGPAQSWRDRLHFVRLSFVAQEEKGVGPGGVNPSGPPKSPGGPGGNCALRCPSGPPSWAFLVLVEAVPRESPRSSGLALCMWIRSTSCMASPADLGESRGRFRSHPGFRNSIAIFMEGMAKAADHRVGEEAALSKRNPPARWPSANACFKTRRPGSMVSLRHEKVCRFSRLHDKVCRFSKCVAFHVYMIKCVAFQSVSLFTHA